MDIILEQFLHAWDGNQPLAGKQRETVGAVEDFGPLGFGVFNRFGFMLSQRSFELRHKLLALVNIISRQNIQGLNFASSGHALV